MDSEQIHEAWWNYLKNMLDPRTTAFPLELPYLFSEPHCATCSHWFLINGEGLHYLATTSSPREYDEIQHCLVKGLYVVFYNFENLGRQGQAAHFLILAFRFGF